MEGDAQVVGHDIRLSTIIEDLVGRELFRTVVALVVLVLSHGKNRDLSQ
jgi:hypothetical protein